MTRKLTTQQVAHYGDLGYLSPIDALATSDAAWYRAQLEASEEKYGPIRENSKGTRPHLLFRWAHQLARNTSVLDAVEDILGPDILLFQLTIFPKEPGSRSIVSWHQDATYFFLDPPTQLTAWIALADAPIEAGCMEVIPGSHRLGQVKHVEHRSPDNLLTNGQTVDIDLDGATTAFLPLKAGQMSFHDTFLLHRSGPNTSTDRRIGFSASYIPASGRCTKHLRPYATLVRGIDSHHHFEPEHAPETDFDERARSAHAAAIKRWLAIRSPAPAASEDSGTP
jgi:hypothetical protein